jgi:RNA polymerase sigma-70 factor (ECF subfamily)
MKGDLMSENDLVRECLQGKKESYRKLMDKYQNYAMAVALNILMNFEDAQDACQEAFLKAFQKLDKFDLKKSFKNWFYTILCNHCLDYLRKKKRLSHMLTKFRTETKTVDYVPQSENPSSSDWVEFRLLRHLSPKERITIYLWSQEGYTGSEIASVLGCSHKTVHVHIYKARKKLKALIKEK